MNRLIVKTADRLLNAYISIMQKGGDNPFPPDCEKRLSLLSPGKPVKQLIYEYYRKKIGNTLIAVIAMIAVIITIIVSNATNTALTKDRSLQRREVGQGDYSVTLRAESEEYEFDDICIGVNERRLTEDECFTLMDELYHRLWDMILADNESLDHIDGDLDLPTAVEGYPFSLRWESSDYLTVDAGGNVSNEDADKCGVPIDLKVIMTYRDTERTYDIKIVVYPLVPEGDELKEKLLNDALKAENEKSASDVYYRLPDSIDGKKIDWKEVNEPVIPIIIILGGCLLLGIWFGTDRDLRNRYEERNKILVIEYAEFVSKLQILLSSGSTIRKAMERMAGDYRKNKEKGGPTKYVYEELLLCVRKLGDGMNEAACYEFFGNRCGVICYKKLASMLIQNLRKGTDGLIEAMDNEVRIAFEERKAAARKMGEEAQTKLMLPMMLMLSVVMIIIMIPAYLSFGGM